VSEDPFNVPALSRTEPRRHESWGGCYLPPPAGWEHLAEGIKSGERYFRRVTTLAKGLDQSGDGLIDWKARHAVAGVLARADLTRLARVTPLDEKSAWKDITERGADAAGANVRRDDGSAFHRLAQADDACLIANGRRLAMASVPKEFRAMLDRYRKIIDDADMTFTHIERMVLNPEVLAVGTLDRGALARGWELPRIVDLKSGKDVDGYAATSIMIQLATYRNAAVMLPEHWDRKGGAAQYLPMPEFDPRLACVVHVDSVTEDVGLYHVDIAEGWVRAKLAATCIAVRSDKTPGVVPFAQEGDAVTVDPEAAGSYAMSGEFYGEPARAAGRTVEAERAITAATIAGDPEMEAEEMRSAALESVGAYPMPTSAPPATPAKRTRKPAGTSREEQREAATEILGELREVREARERREREAACLTAIATAPDKPALGALWAEYRDVWSDAMTTAGNVRLATLAGAE
jgi:hypothetical protein